MSKQTSSSKSLSFSLLSLIRFFIILLFFFLLSYLIFGIFSRGPINTHAVTTGTDSNGQTYWDFTYTGAAETWTVPSNGKYKIELWGSEGYGTSTAGTGHKGGYGGYSAGEITMTQGGIYHLYVGRTIPSSFSPTGGYDFNGGSQNAGVATDIRIIGGAWNATGGLNSRIMVAGGGGGSDNGYGDGGFGGGLTAGDGTIGPLTNPTYSVQTYGGTQTAGGIGNVASGMKCTGTYLIAPGFGVSGVIRGGSGYYGGGDGCYSGGGGGSSYISGHTGAVAVVSSSSTSPRTGTGGAACSTGTSDNLCSIHYSGLSFENTVMIDGAGYKWTNTKGALESMPKPSGGYYASGTGHTGNGYARITQLSIEPELSVVWDNDTISFGSKPGLTSREYTATTTANISGATYGFTSSIDSSSDTCLRHSSIISQEDPLNPTPTNCTNTTTNYKIPLTNTISPEDSDNSTATLTLTSKATTSASNVAGEYSGVVTVTVMAKDPPPPNWWEAPCETPVLIDAGSPVATLIPGRTLRDATNCKNWNASRWDNTQSVSGYNTLFRDADFILTREQVLNTAFDVDNYYALTIIAHMKKNSGTSFDVGVYGKSQTCGVGGAGLVEMNFYQYYGLVLKRSSPQGNGYLGYSGSLGGMQSWWPNSTVRKVTIIFKDGPALLQAKMYTDNGNFGPVDYNGCSLYPYTSGGTTVPSDPSILTERRYYASAWVEDTVYLGALSIMKLDTVTYEDFDLAQARAEWDRLSDLMD